MKSRIIYILYCLVMVIYPHESTSQSAQVPYHIQAAFWGKIFKHIPQLDDKRVKILIVYDTKSETKKTTLMENIKSLGFEVNAVKPDQLVREITGYDVVYFMEELQKYATLCREKHKLSICGTPEYVETGAISIALGIENDKPRISINIKLLQAEGKDVTVELLKISQVFR